MLILLALLGCAEPIQVVTSDDALVMKKPSATPTPTSTFVSVDLVGLAGDGGAIPCADGELTVAAELTLPDGTVVTVDPASTELVCGPEVAPDVALVLDNSGSQDEVLEATRAGARDLAADVLAADGRVSVVRVSTYARELVPLSSDDATLDAAFADLFVNRGWTALWDAVRLGNESLAVDHVAPAATTDLADFCATRRSPRVVVFSNGVDNNSDEARLGGAGDGIDTTFDDVAGMTVDGVVTPIDTIGLGRDLDAQRLADLSAATGGTHLSLAGEGWIDDAFGLASTWDDATWRLCAEVETTTCGEATIEVTYDFRRKCNQGLGNGAEGCDPGNSNHQNPSNDEPGSPGRGNGDPQSDAAGTTTVSVATGTRTVTLHVPCRDGATPGRAAAVMLPLADAPDADALARDLVAWAGEAATGLDVAVIHDDTAPDADALRVADALRAAGHAVTVGREPATGLRVADVEGFDVVWFSAPGRPMDDHASYDLLRWHASTGHGVIVQGEDVGRSLGGGFDPASLAGLAYVDPGLLACGARVDAGGAWEVSFDADHAAVASLGGATWTVRADLDGTAPLGRGEEVVAWATARDDAGCERTVPAIAVLDP